MDDNMDEAIQEREALMASLANVSDETKTQCRITVLELFSDMDPDHLSRACEQGRWNPEDIISQVVNDMEDGKPYPKTQKMSLKRKRDDDEEDLSSPEKTAKKWDNAGRRSQFRDAKSSYTRMRSVFFFSFSKPPTAAHTRTQLLWLSLLTLFSHSILQQFFPQMYVENLKSFMTLNGGILYPTYLLLSKATAAGDEANPLFRKKKGRVPKSAPFLAGILDERIRNCRDEGEREALQEVRAARIAEHIEATEAAEAKRKEQEELENFELAKLEGTVTDCGCCFVEYAINRMVHCDGEEVHVSGCISGIDTLNRSCLADLILILIISSFVGIVREPWQRRKSAWPNLTWTACRRMVVRVVSLVVSESSSWIANRGPCWNKSRWMPAFGHQGLTTSKPVLSVPLQQ